MSFGSPESSKEFPGLYGHERHSDSDSEAQASKQLIGKRKDKKDKDIGYAALGDSSGDEDEDGKSPLRGKLGNPFKFSKKEKREKDKQKEHKEKEVKTKEVKEKDLKVRKDARELYREEKLKEKEKHKEEKHKEKEKMKEEKEKMKEKTKEKTKEDKSKEKSKESKELKHKESIKETAKEASEGRSKRKKKEQAKSSERKKSVPALAEEDEPVFGVPLALAVERSKCHDGILLPAVVRECIDYIEQNGLNCEGIYRLSGVKSKVQQLKRGYNQRDTVCLYDHEPHTVASLLKLFLRELPEPVLTAELLPLFDAAAGQKAPERRVQQLSELLARLPDPNRLLVQYMFKHMEHIIKREKINKMNVQNVSLVLSPTMQISHRVLNAFFLYGKILFSGVAIKRYVPPIADGELPDTAQAISEEIDKQESLLSQLHQQLKSGSITQRREEQLWEAQRILTQLKRRQRFVTKRSETETTGKTADSESAGEAAAAASSDDSAAPVPATANAPASTGAESAAAAAAATVAAATAPQKLERTVQIINEDNVTVIQIGEKSAPTAAVAAADDGEAAAESKPAAESDGASPKPGVTEPTAATAAETGGEGEAEAGAGTPSPPSAAKVQREGQKETEPERKTSSASLPAEVRQKPQISEPAPEQAKSVPELDRAEPVSPAEVKEATAAGSSLPPAGDESQASFSDLHRRIVASVGSPAEPTAPTALPTAPPAATPAAQAAATAPPAAVVPPTAPPLALAASAAAAGVDPLESEQTAELLRQLILLKLEEDELVSTGRELRSRLAAERSEIGRLKDTIHEMETLYKYRTYSVDSSDDSSGDDSDGSDTEEEMLRQLREVIRHNQQIEAKNAQLVRAIHEERRLCQKRRAQIRYLELQSAGQ